MKELYHQVVHVEQIPGIMIKVMNVFSKRGFTVDTITVSETQSETIRKITLTLYGEENEMEQLSRHLYNIPNVIDAEAVKDSQAITRELILFKVPHETARSMEFNQFIDEMDARFVRYTEEYIAFEYSANIQMVNTFEDRIRKFQYIELSRTGAMIIHQ